MEKHPADVSILRRYSIKSSEPSHFLKFGREAQWGPCWRVFRTAEVLSVVDGDTLDLHIDLGFRVYRKLRARLAGVAAAPAHAESSARFASLALESIVGCGDGNIEGLETCDNGPHVSDDGCSAACHLEPQCSAPDECTQICGDGVLTTPEECDDGNLLNLDGCGSDCMEESGYECVLDQNETSECVATCGDSIVGLGEECDFGINSGGYNGCNVDCTLSGYCGDGVVQPEFEACDGADPNVPSFCSGCRILTIR